MIPVIEPIARLSAQLARLPGVGAKTAQRLAYYLLGVPKEQADELAAAIVSARELVRSCPVCGGYTDMPLCALCADTGRDAATVCVVQDARDIMAIEKSRAFFGKYHVLNGALSPMEGIGPDDIRIAELVQRVDAGGVMELILATNPDVEGEATASYIARLFKDKAIRMTRLAHGIPIGGNLEYTDGVTLAKALSGRTAL
ncbi:MAG: recombination mediator RecR [Clostridiales bacterium]|jgi:recombination protein RecR|nr:recombination mediator RecR [Clostridiales bacterium]